MKNIYVDFDKNASKGYPAMLCGVEEMCKRGIYADNIEKLLLENVTVKQAKDNLLDIIENSEIMSAEYVTDSDIPVLDNKISLKKDVSSTDK